MNTGINHLPTIGGFSQSNIPQGVRQYWFACCQGQVGLRTSPLLPAALKENAMDQNREIPSGRYWKRSRWSGLFKEMRRRYCLRQLYGGLDCWQRGAPPNRLRQEKLAISCPLVVLIFKVDQITQIGSV